MTSLTHLGSISRVLSAILVAATTLSAAAQDATHERPRADLREHARGVNALTFSADGKLLASTGDEGTVKIWDLVTNQVKKELAPRGGGGGGLRQTPRRVEAILFNPVGHQFAEASTESNQQGMLRIWNADEASNFRVLGDRIRNPRSVAFSPDGKVVFANMGDGDKPVHKLVAYDAESGKVLYELRDDRLAASMIAVSPDGKTLATAGGTKLLLWDIDGRKVRHVVASIKKALVGISFSPDSAFLATVTADDFARIWKSTDGTMVREFRLDHDGVDSVAFSASGKTLVTGGKDNAVKLWNPETGRLFKTLWLHAGRVVALAFSPDGKTLASGGRDGLIALWNFDESTHVEEKPDPDADKKRAEEKKRQAKEKAQRERERKGEPGRPGGRGRQP